MNLPTTPSQQVLSDLAMQVKTKARSLGFAELGITDINLQQAEQRLLEWLAQQYHGEMDYMQRHGTMRSRPDDLLPGTLRVLSVRMAYLPEQRSLADLIDNKQQAVISCYAQGRDYHKLIRKRLQTLIGFIDGLARGYQYRAFTDSAPVMEKPLAEKAGLGWIGKHTNLIHKQSGSWFFLGTVYTDLPLPIDVPATGHCGSCHACMDVCPTKAIIAPYKLDASRCISYLTIELRGSIPVEFRKAIGNRIYGCDDCQLVCPWNKFADRTAEQDFLPRNHLNKIDLLSLWAWSEQDFLERLQGSAIRRIGYECWLRNLAIALGNAPYQPQIVTALTQRAEHSSALVREHVQWALAEQNQQRENAQRCF